ncbi:hypothetical protein R1flu_026239 [Riccia fluitans]|uniref:Uncharacterized protein n=1 Tax=Riccia fluitans TaxID=41844 RepID=A0ABD1XIC1_9MARC
MESLRLLVGRSSSLRDLESSISPCYRTDIVKRGISGSRKYVHPRRDCSSLLSGLDDGQSQLGREVGIKEVIRSDGCLPASSVGVTFWKHRRTCVSGSGLQADEDAAILQLRNCCASNFVYSWARYGD